MAIKFVGWDWKSQPDFEKINAIVQSMEKPYLQLIDDSYGQFVLAISDGIIATDIALAEWNKYLDTL